MPEARCQHRLTARRALLVRVVQMLTRLIDRQRIARAPRPTSVVMTADVETHERA